MEQQIQGQLMSCLYKQCFEKLFTWNYHSHIECCPYKPLKCLFCKEDTCLSYLKYHIRNEPYWCPVVCQANRAEIESLFQKMER